MTDRPWWDGATLYEVYVRSFQDSDGDGVGDLPGVRQRLPEVAALGVDALWLTPFYPSPMHDHGYDVADHRDVDPLFGTLADLDALVAEADRLGLRVVVDLVPNHTSSQHPWFVAARSSRTDPHRERYIWRDPAPDGGPPNNWMSTFGGPAWTLDPGTGQYYLHLFLPEQPDLNWAHPAVVAEFDAILRFWLDRGVDGFRIDVAHALVKDPDLRDNPVAGDVPAPDAPAAEVFGAYEHRHDVDQPGVLDIYRRWRAIADRAGALLLGEVYLLDPRAVARYVVEQDGLHLALYVAATRCGWDADEVRAVLVDGVEEGAGHFAWPLSSHDDHRAPSRFGGGERGARRALAYTGLLAGLPGALLLYQGDELGLDDVVVPEEERQDRGGDRDAVRTPMPWRPGPGCGFTTGRPWLPVGERPPERTFAAQAAEPTSHLHRTRRLLAVRRDIAAEAPDAPVEWLTDDGPVIAYRRGGWTVAGNLGGAPAGLPEGEVVWRSGDTSGGAELAPDETVITAQASAML